MSPLARCQAVTADGSREDEHKIRCQLPASHKGDHEHYDGEPAPVTWASAEPRPALTIGELHARAKALGLKAAGAIGSIARAAFSASAEALGETGDRQAWRELGSVHRRAWRSAVLAALEALPEPDVMQRCPASSTGACIRELTTGQACATGECTPKRPPFPGALAQPEGGLKPGDVVSVRGVVKYVATTAADVAFDDDGGLRTVPLMLADLTFIERPAPPEPTWAPGNLAEDDAGEAYVYRRGYNDTRSWWRVRDGVRCARGDEPGDDRILGPLYKLTVTRQDAP